ncbi:MAG TPA: 4'-phosphopantetheinyl transferase superfamily protein [Kofleriaceae bacterium]|nr:4'-phosphopantetheinyl transferase superfamily protein [Kofleriaceae bacterium]
MIGDDEVEVWFADPAAIDAGAVAILDAGERARMERFVFERDRQLFLAAHALVRRSLSRHADVAPDAWRFRAENGEKPVIAGPAPVPPLSFNLSHCRGLVACAIARGREVGVDVERIAELPRDLIDTIASPAEAAALRALPAAAQAERFFTLWTLKEAYVKARGQGLALPVEEACFYFGAPGAPGAPGALSPPGAPGAPGVLSPPLAPPRFVPGPPLADDPAAWMFVRLRPTQEHCAALCIARPPARATQHWAR